MLEALLLAVDLGMAVLIWLVQLIVYPTFREVDRQRFRSWHRDYRRRVSFVVVPLMLGQVGLHGAALSRDATGWGIASAVAIAGAWAVTFVRSVPCHAVLQRDGADLEAIETLVTTNWWRTALWSLAFVLSLAATAAT